MRQRNDELVKNGDIDRVAFQHEITDLKKKIVDQRAKYDTLDEKHRILSKSFREMTEIVETLGKDLNEERKKSADLEKQLLQDKSSKLAESEVQY
jgi:hypothetical protein